MIESMNVCVGSRVVAKVKRNHGANRPWQIEYRRMNWKGNASIPLAFFRTIIELRAFILSTYPQAVLRYFHTSEVMENAA